MASGTGIGSVSSYAAVKYLFFLFNIIFWMMGCALLGLGIWLHVTNDMYSTVSDSGYLSVTSVCIAAGGCMIVVSFCGCCGAIMENKCMLLIYFALVLLIFIVEVSLGIVVFVYRSDIDDELRQELLDSLDQYPSDKGVRKAWDKIQREFECCGVYNESDWYIVFGDGVPGDGVTPDSCCKFEADNCGRSPENPKFYKGCYDEVKDKLEEYLYILGIAVLVIGFLQILGIIASMALFCFLRSEKYDDYYA